MQELKNISLLKEGKLYSLKQLLFEDFKSIGGALPIKGGWGYSEEDAIIIDEKDKDANTIGKFNGVAIEYLIVEKRLYEELIIFKRIKEKFSGIEWKLLKQRSYSKDAKTYDHLRFKVTCFRNADFDKLKDEYEAERDNSNFDILRHKRKKDELMYFFITDYYFDITSFFNIHYIKILIANDHSINRQSLKFLFKNKSHIQIIGEAISFSNLFEVLRKCKPDILITDDIMPAGDAFKALPKIKQLYPDIKIIGTTNYDNPDYLEKLKKEVDILLVNGLVTEEDFINAVDVVSSS